MKNRYFQSENVTVWVLSREVYEFTAAWIPLRQCIEIQRIQVVLGMDAIFVGVIRAQLAGQGEDHVRARRPMKLLSTFPGGNGMT